MMRWDEKQTTLMNESKGRCCDYGSDARRALLSNSHWAESMDRGMSVCVCVHLRDRVNVKPILDI